MESRDLPPGEQQQHETQHLPAFRQIWKGNAVHGLVELLVQVVHPELVEVAQHRVLGPVDEAGRGRCP